MNFNLAHAGMEFDLEETMNSLSMRGYESDEDLTFVSLKKKKIVNGGKVECHQGDFTTLR